MAASFYSPDATWLRANALMSRGYLDGLTRHDSDGGGGASTSRDDTRVIGNPDDVRTAP